MRNLVLVALGFGFMLALGCTPRSYEVKTTTTATTVVEKKSQLLVSWDEINKCDYIVDKGERASCFERLLVSLRLAKQVDSGRTEYEALEKVVHERLCVIYADLGRDSPEYCPKPEEPKPTVMDIYICEICPSVKHFVRGAEFPEKYPDGWQLTIPPDKQVIYLKINGEIFAEMDQGFSHFVIEAVEGLPDASGKRSIVVEIQREGEYKECSAEPANPD